MSVTIRLKTTKDYAKVQGFSRYVMLLYASIHSVYIPAFETIAAQLMKQYNTGEMSFLPKVEPGGEEQKAFEDFAYNFYYNVRRPPFPNGTAVWDDVRGITGAEDGVYYHDTTGLPKPGFWKSGDPKQPLSFPLLQHDQGPFFLLLRNYYLHEPKGVLLRAMTECALQRKWKQDLDMDCSGMTGLLWKRTSQLLVPVYPAEDPFEFTGVIQTRIIWESTIGSLFVGDNVTGLVCVLEFEDRVVTYEVRDGAIELL